MFGTGPIRLMTLSLRRAYLRAESGGHLAATADQIDYWIRRHLVPCPPQRNVNPARDRLVALTTIGRTLRDQYDALAAPAPRQLAALVKQLEARKPTASLVGYSSQHEWNRKSGRHPKAARELSRAAFVRHRRAALN
jgi:hypothetical protein